MSTTTGSEQGMAGGLLLLSALLTSAGVALWMGRNLYHWAIAGSATYLGWERGFIMASMVAALLGLTLLEGLLKDAGVPTAAGVGLMLFLVATVLGLSWEANVISQSDASGALIATHVVLALLAQAAVGLALLQTGLLAGWIGWATIIWNLGWLVMLPLLNTGDLYYPVIHMAMPLLIGVALLVKR